MKYRERWPEAATVQHFAGHEGPFRFPRVDKIPICRASDAGGGVWVHDMCPR